MLNIFEVAERAARMREEKMIQESRLSRQTFSESEGSEKKVAKCS
jgi:hypothetical protein